MATNVLMPQLGESIVEGTIVRWNKQVGDHVDRDEPLLEVSTDKIDAEIPAPAGGIVTEVRAQVGETVPVDSVVAIIGTADDADDEGEPSGEVARSASDGLAQLPVARAASRPPRKSGLSPLVRKLTREHGIDPSTVVGTGAGGRVTKDDVLKHAEAQREAPVAKLLAGARVVPLSPMRRSIAEHMVLSRRTSAHVHTVFDVDFTAVEALRLAHRDDYERQGAKLTYLSFIAKAVVDALVDMPVVNAALTNDGTDVVYKATVNLGIAVALGEDGADADAEAENKDDVDAGGGVRGGLIVPVVKDAAHKNVLELSRGIADVASRARTGQLVPDDVLQGTFTITNPGSFGSIFGLPIINQPQVAILCVGAVERRPVVVDDVGTIEARVRSYLTLGFDHRLIDGAIADRFMSKVKSCIEQFDGGTL